MSAAALDALRAALGESQVLTGDAMAPWSRDWTGQYRFSPRAVLRPRGTGQVQDILRIASRHKLPVVPVSGNSGLAGGTAGEGALMLSLDRMNRIHEIRPAARIARVEAGVVLQQLHEATDAHGLAFPLTFGARGTALIGGVLSTNAGGSNVLRYGNTRDLCLGLEVVLASGEVMDLMSELHKDNSGYNLKHLMIGAEGTLGVITQAVLKLVPKPRAYATAMVAVRGLPDALDLLNRLQEATGGAVEAFEYMAQPYFEALKARFPETRPAFDQPHDVSLLVEVGATAPRDVTPGPDGTVPIAAYLEDVLGQLLEEGAVLDAVVAQNEAQRAEMWQRRERAGEVSVVRLPLVNNDVALPLDKVETFLARADARVAGIDAGARPIVVAHLGDGNVHYVIWPSADDDALKDAIMEAVEDVVLDLGGSFSAEHGIGLAKKPSMARRKDAVALDAMRAIKAALDPDGILNPGKVLPARA